MSNVVSIPNKRDWKYHANKIAVAWNKQVVSIIETGQALIDAKEELDHGAFDAMVQSKLPFARNTAHRLRQIAEHHVLSNVAHAPHLPASWSTLYELTKLPDDVLLAKLKDKTIHPKMERKDAKALRSNAKPKSPPKPKPVMPAKLETMRQTYLTAAKALTKEEKKNEIFKLLDALGLALHIDFVHQLTLRK